ncbi:MAG: glycosyltransferase family 2 protein [Bacteroidetes bacterium]|nr:glycosyltransferase family 2 protein [Bacteroidota bacterium]
MQPFFSVIIPTYNRANLIGKAIESVFVQTFAQWELVIVDDGSTDNTKEVVQAYNDKRINYVFQKNAERSAARNNGIENATGKYICFLDSDDYYLPERLELLHKEVANKNFPVAVFYTGLLLDKDGELQSREEKIQEGSTFEHLTLSVIHSQQTCIHYEILKQFKYDLRFRVGEDMELWLRIATKFPFLFLAHQATIVVVIHDDRSINVKRYNASADYVRMLGHIFLPSHSGNKISSKRKRQMLSAGYFGMAKHFIYNKSKRKAVKNLCLAILNDPINMQTKYRLNIIRHLLLGSGKAVLLLEE